jgi:DNA mismatch repair protein MutL
MTSIPTSQSTPERPIRVLPPHLINRIAAGEVVERPASVIKELVENALDAGATRIEISASNGGRNLRVADNGSGMTPENAALAFYNHATSKIQDEADLDRITTLGFRGEALASIGAISKLTCWTRRADAPVGTKITVSETGEPVLSEAGCAPGTVMEVDDLFYNTPARLKFLKRAQTELGHIEEIVQFLALSHPEVRFSLTVNDKVVLKTTGSNALKRAMEEVLGLKDEKIPLLPITAEDSELGLRVAGFASEPGVMKSSKRWIMTYLNGRHVRCAILQKAIEAAYESLLPQGRYPVCVIFVNLPTSEVDVNVHPAKREVRYAAANTVFGFVRSGIRNSLSAQGIRLDVPVLEASAPPVSHWPASPGDLSDQHFSANRLLDASRTPGRMPTVGGAGPNYKSLGYNHSHSNQPASDRLPAYRQTSYADPQPVQAALGFYALGHSLNPIPEVTVSAQAAVSAVEPGAETEPSVAKPAFANGKFKVIGQLFNTYILLETVQGLLVVDQHIASERDFFESLTLNLTAETSDIQRLVTALPLTVSPVQRDLLVQYQGDFAQLGFLYDLSGDSSGGASAGLTVQLTGYPLVYAGRDGMFEAGGLFENLLAQLEETGHMKLDLDHLIATLACHSAVRAGDSLTHAEMETVIERWLACRLPWTCPHGRPIAHTISTTELNQFFHRPSLPVNAF